MQSASGKDAISVQTPAPRPPHTVQEAKKESTSTGVPAPHAPHTLPEAKKESTSPGPGAPHAPDVKKQSTPPKAAAPPSEQASLERQSPRKNLHVGVCLRHPEYGQEVVTSENISGGGFRIKSEKDYPLGTVLEAAVPYAPGVVNVFAPARLVYKLEEPESPRNRDSTPPARILPGPPKTS